MYDFSKIARRTTDRPGNSAIFLFLQHPILVKIQVIVRASILLTFCPYPTLVDARITLITCEASVGSRVPECDDKILDSKKLDKSMKS